MNRKVTFGTISHGTLRTVDLAEAFAAELDYLDSEALARIDAEYAEVADAEDWEDIDEETLSWYVGALSDALQELAPPYAYFGALESDSSDFGFWPDVDALQSDSNVLRVSDTSEVPDDYVGDVMHISDHGNVTLYTAEGGRLSEVWSIV